MSNEITISTYFLTFGNQLYYDALKRIEKQARDINLFSKITCFSDVDLQNDLDFWSQHGKFILDNPRGYGYWIWKPYLILKQLQNMKENDLLVYADAGCDIIPSQRYKIIDFFHKLVNSPTLCNVSVEMNREFCIEKKWTKMNLFKHLQCEYLTDSYQFHATYFILKKCKKTMDMVSLWYNICCKENYIYLSDIQDSLIPNDPIFHDHRHDQSIFSLIRKCNLDSCIVVKQCTEGHFIMPTHNKTINPSKF